MERGADIDEVRQAAEELKRRYENNKLLYYKPCCRIHSRWEQDEFGKERPIISCPTVPCPESKHALFHKSDARIRVVFGGNRCIAGDTLIEDPILNKKVKIKDIKNDFHVWAWDGEKLVKARAEKPFVKGFDDLYEVKFSNEETIVCTQNHRMLTDSGYRALSSLLIGDKLVSPRASAVSPVPSISGLVRSIRVLNARSFLKTVEGFLFGCLSYLRSNDARLRLVEDSAQDVFPLQVDAQGYGFSFFSPFLHEMDGSVRRNKYNRSYEQSDLLSNQDGLRQTAAPSVDTLYRFACKLYKSVSRFLPTALQSKLGSFLLLSKPKSSQPANQSSNVVLPSNPPISDVTEVVSITYCRRDFYYDFTVPFFSNYCAAGVVHHNSSKTFSGVAEMLMTMCLKTHPYRKTGNPGAATGTGRFRIYSSDFAIIEKLFLPLLRDLIPMNSLAGKGETKGEKFENSYDPKYHTLQLKSGLLDFMSYDQDQSKSESVELDAAMADEEMPENIYSATLSRLISRNGRFWMTVTPLYGMSWGMQFLENSDPQCEVFRWEIFDNPYINRKSIEDFEKSITNPLEKESRIYGRFMEFQGLVYKELDRTIHLLGSDKPKSNYPVIMALDPHPRRPSMITWAFVTPKDDLVFFDEMEVGGVAKDIVRAIKERESTHGARTVLRLIDPAARSQGNNISFETDTLREFEEAGMGFTLADNSEAGYGIVHEYLGYDHSRSIDSMNRPRCYFTKDVPKVWYSMTHLMWDEWAFRRQKHWKDKKERVRDYQKDGSDVARYILAERPTFRKMMMSPLGVPTGNWQNANNFQQEESLRRLFIPV